eukprot:CAMPEP_0170874214 /NCGR_PEP_ID=MMETSP0734-20130129/27975_1 /TAXON_ID=186038 /ORGANISM="Fragilariopsis kerguelensis, Strain L26-C5" /LENGTH=130 /DNA_ID=CAMNT_0011255041 /DNA_START=278 /DNA_END=670 /DNA_ORIENTATION=+
MKCAEEFVATKEFFVMSSIDFSDVVMPSIDFPVVVMSSIDFSVLDEMELAVVCLRVYFERSIFESNFLRELNLDGNVFERLGYSLVISFDAREEADDDFVSFDESDPVFFLMHLSGLIFLKLSILDLLEV